MDLFSAIAKRHSYRGDYELGQVSREDLQQIVAAGLQAPSGKNEQTTTFVILDNPELVSKVHEMHPTNRAMQQARAYIACIIDRAPCAIYEGHSFQIEDCAAAVENMLLAITALGYASVWIDGWLRLDNRAKTIGSLIGVPEEKVIRVLLPIGKPTETRSPAAKKSFEARAWFNCYQGSK